MPFKWIIDVMKEYIKEEISKLERMVWRSQMIRKNPFINVYILHIFFSLIQNKITVIIFAQDQTIVGQQWSGPGQKIQL